MGEYDKILRDLYIVETYTNNPDMLKKDIAAEVGLDPSTVGRILKSYECPMRRQRVISHFETEPYADLKEASKKFDVHLGTIYHIIHNSPTLKRTSDWHLMSLRKGVHSYTTYSLVMDLAKGNKTLKELALKYKRTVQWVSSLRCRYQRETGHTLPSGRPPSKKLKYSECKVCGKKYDKLSHRKTCSDICSRKSHERRGGIYSNKMISLKCTTCGKVFERNQMILGKREQVYIDKGLKKTNNHFCSRECHYEHKRGSKYNPRRRKES